MTTTPLKGISTDDAWALLEGRHPDPFAVLGLHKIDKQWLVTVLMPEASNVVALTGKGTANPLLPVDGFPGLFQGPLKRQLAYRIHVKTDQTEWTYDDPYRFGPVLGELDEYLLGEGTHQRLWQVLGAMPIVHEKVKGTHFAVWAPNASRVSVVGHFNSWNGLRHPMRRRGSTGVWELFIPGITDGEIYKYEIRDAHGQLQPLKADPVGFGSEHPPANGSVVRDIDGAKWHDKRWMQTRADAQNIHAPISIYEVHLGSWRRKTEDGNRPLSYLEHAVELIDYVSDMGFTHIELLPITEFPFDGSWGYQPIGLYAPTIRFGTPEEFRKLIDRAHQQNIGVLLDWVPGHFPTDAHGLGRFDGSALYEHEDPREGFHQDWNTLIYNYGRREVSNYLTSNALYWLEEYHLDGLRVDAVASMLYRDYSREDGQWIPNKDGGRENYEAIDFLKKVNQLSYGEAPGIMTVAEESTAFPGVSRPVDHGGLGFGFKWNMGWMNDTLSYIEKDPIYRQYHHHQMTFGLHYAYSENYILPISHDEVVHGKGSMLAKMPGDGEEKFANLRAYYGFMWGHPGKKLLFMGCEFAQGAEWNHAQSLDWHQLEHPLHRGVQSWVRDLNKLYVATPALHYYDTDPRGFTWLEAADSTNSVYAFARHGEANDPDIIVVCNFTPVERAAYRVGFTHPGQWQEVLNSDASHYGGQDRGNMGTITTEPVPWHHQHQSAAVVLPPLSVVIFKQLK